MDHYILNLGSAILAFTAIWMLKPFKTLVHESMESNIPVMSWVFNSRKRMKLWEISIF